MVRAIALMSILCFSGYAYSAWHVKTETNKMTDQSLRIATIKNKESVFGIYEDGAGTYIGVLIITKPLLQIYYDPKIIEIRVDKKHPLQLDMTNWEPQRAYFNIPINLLDEIYSGHRLLVQFPYSSTQAVVEEYRLIGTSKAFRSALKSYTPRAARNKAALKEKKEQDAYAKHQQDDEEKEAIQNCPKAWANHKKEEKSTGRPQLWRGCPN